MKSTSKKAKIFQLRPPCPAANSSCKSQPPTEAECIISQSRFLRVCFQHPRIVFYTILIFELILPDVLFIVELRLFGHPHNKVKRFGSRLSHPDFVSLFPFERRLTQIQLIFLWLCGHAYWLLFHRVGLYNISSPFGRLTIVRLLIQLAWGR